MRKIMNLVEDRDQTKRQQLERLREIFNNQMDHITIAETELQYLLKQGLANDGYEYTEDYNNASWDSLADSKDLGSVFTLFELQNNESDDAFPFYGVVACRPHYEDDETFISIFKQSYAEFKKLVKFAEANQYRTGKPVIDKQQKLMYADIRLESYDILARPWAQKLLAKY